MRVGRNSERAYLGIAGQLVNLTERIIASNRLEKEQGFMFSKLKLTHLLKNNELRTENIIVGFK